MKNFFSMPGVYIPEQSFLPRTIQPASTSIAAIIGSFTKGPLKTPKQVRTWAEFEQEFGGLSASTPASACVKQFFDNEGKALWVVRIGTRKINVGSPFLQGLSILDGIQDFNILCIPQTEQLPDIQASLVIQAAVALVEKHRAMYLLDVPQRDSSRQTVSPVTTWLSRQQGIHRSNVVIFVPRVQVPSERSSMQTIPASGTMAGLLARTDQHRGVWKSPAGTEAILQGVTGLDRVLTSQDINQLTAANINALKQIYPTTYVAWGARTLSSDPEWKYVAVRRTAFFLESSIQQGTTWAVFEPNDEPLWAQIRQSVTNFMQDLFRQGAFQGTKPQDAYFVRCGRETTTSADQATGIVNMVVGFAPIKPAEFVILTIKQKTIART